MANQEDWYCYILCRYEEGDLPSLSRGKLAAQVHHSGVKLATKYHNHSDFKKYIKAGIEEGADFFNTTITLSSTLEQINVVVEIAQKLGYLSDTILDPSYPYTVTKEAAKALGAEGIDLQNGMIGLTRPEVTCGFLLGNRNDPVFRALTMNLELLK